MRMNTQTQTDSHDASDQAAGIAGPQSPMLTVERALKHHHHAQLHTHTKSTYVFKETVLFT